MSATRILLALVALSAWSPGALAGIDAEFRLDHCAWHATHVVVATEGRAIDGDVEVLESWVGDLGPGDRITVPGLAEFAPDAVRAIPQWLPGAARLPARVTGSRVVLFLVRKQEKPGGGKPDVTTWLPADQHHKRMRTSMAWVEAGKVFALVQLMNPGRSQPVFQDLDEPGLKRQVCQVAAARPAFTAALRQDDPAKLAAVSLPLIRAESVFVQYTVIDALGEAGAKGLPALRAVIKDESMLGWQPAAVVALAKAGGAAAGPELTEVLKQELAFWKDAGPKLKPDWFDVRSRTGFGPLRGDDPSDAVRLEYHYSRAYATLGALKDIRFAGSRETATAFRDLWRPLDKRNPGSSKLSDQCDELLAALPRP